jgi:hypothetical protein
VHRRIIDRVKNLLPLQRRALLFRLVVPRRFWFPAVLALSRVSATILHLAGLKAAARYEAFCVDGWLSELTLRGPFPVKYKLVGAEHLAKSGADEAGLLYCTVHLPLAAVMMRACMESGASPDFVLAAPHNIDRHGQWVPAGMATGFNALPPGPSLIRRVRTVLSEGGRFATMADHEVGGPLRPTLMRLAGSVRARVILCWAVMNTNRTIVVTYRTAPHPIPDTEEKVWANLAVLEEQRERVLANLLDQRWGVDLDSDSPVPKKAPGVVEGQADQTALRSD